MTIYFDTKHALEVHDDILQKSGGNIGILNIGLLHSVIEHIKNDDYYPNIEDKITHLFFSVNKNHAFNDGNKRSSIALSAYFMEINGYGFEVVRFLKEMENIAVDVADNRIGKDLLHEIICSLLFEADFSDELKLRIIDAKRQ